MEVSPSRPSVTLEAETQRLLQQFCGKPSSSDNARSHTHAVSSATLLYTDGGDGGQNSVQEDTTERHGRSSQQPILVQTTTDAAPQRVPVKKPMQRKSRVQPKSRPSSEQILRLNELRRRLLSAGLWYEDVDRCIRECETEEQDVEKSSDLSNDLSDSSLTLIPEDCEPLTLKDALGLLKGYNWGFDLTNEQLHPSSEDEAVPTPRSSTMSKLWLERLIESNASQLEYQTPWTTDMTRSPRTTFKHNPSASSKTPQLAPKFARSPTRSSVKHELEVLRTSRLGRLRGIFTNVASHLRDGIEDDLHPWKTWKGASHDVTNVAWSTDGNKYAIGTAALTDQYNRPNNLLVGNVPTSTLSELSGHYCNNPQATVYNGDPKRFTAVTAVQWSRTFGRDILYTASYDRTVKIWDVQDPLKVSCLRTIRHPHKVTELAVSGPTIGLFVTGTEYAQSLRVFRHNETSSEISKVRLGLSFTSSTHTSTMYSCTALQFGSCPNNREYLSAGFTSGCLDELSIRPTGHLGLWKLRPDSFTPLEVLPSAQNIFDIAWHPNELLFATANAAPLSQRRKHRVQSMVRVYQPPHRWRMAEYDCPAADLNTVTFCPYDTNYITASATDGSTYVWDYRQPGEILLTLRHGAPLAELSHHLPRELEDTGVRVALWGNRTCRFYTGSSDGVLKEWDIRRAAEDALTRDVVSLDAGIMSASFSPQKSELLIGDVAGGVHLLSTAPLDEEDIRYVPDTDRVHVAGKEEDPLTVGRRTAAELIATGQMEIIPGIGAGQGPNYNGPWASWATEEDRKERIVHRRREKRRQRETMERRPELSTKAAQEIIILSDDDEFGSASATMNQPMEKTRKKISVKEESAQEGNRTTEDEIEYEGTQEKEKKSKKKKKRTFVADEMAEPLISAPSADIVDLTLSDGEHRTEQPLPASPTKGQCSDDEYSDSGAEMTWFPPNWSVDANIKYEGA